MSRPKLGYLIGSHVAYIHKSLPRLLTSMFSLGIPGESIVVNVNGSKNDHAIRSDGVHLFLTTGERSYPAKVIVDYRMHEKLNIHYWLQLNCTSECGPQFRELSEAGFSLNADATLAGAALNLGSSGGKWGRAINDLAVYKADYLVGKRQEMEMWDTEDTDLHISDLEGYMFAHAPTQAAYPNHGYTLDRNKLVDVYNTGVKRATEYYTAIDWFRYKKNFGQLGHDSYKVAEV